jgi:hypothetical protein
MMKHSSARVTVRGVFWLKSLVRVGNAVMLVVGLAGLTGGSVFANTLAYWRFEGDGSIPPTNGVFLKDTNGRTAVQPDGILAIDSSGNGNSLYTWDNNSTGHQYTNNVPAAIVPQTGAPNTFSIYNNGSFPASFTWSKNSLPSLDIEPLVLTNWTIEASILGTSFPSFATFVGRDGNGVATNTGGFILNEFGTLSNSGTDGNLAPLYFSARSGRLWVQFTDADGRTYQLADPTGTLSLNTWYNVAAVSDGTTLYLYRDSGSGYVLLSSLALAGTGNTALTYDAAGSNTAGDTQWGWTVGRGRYGSNDAQGQNHVDRWFGRLDEVRISDMALDPSQFLFTVPEPGTVALVLLGAVSLIWGCRRKQ